MERILPLFGILAMVGLCLAFSRDRKTALRRWQLLAWGFGLQFIFALLILKFPGGQIFFQWFNDAFVAVAGCTEAGAAFIFGTKLTDPTTGLGYFAFYVLPTIIFFSALAGILYHLGVLQLIVRGLAWIMSVTMKTSGAETLSASGNIFLGQTEAPLMIRPFIGNMTRSELMTVMSGGFATVAGSVMAAYVGFLKDFVPNAAGHLLAASVMSAPAALVFGKLLVPETGDPETLGKVNIDLPKRSTGVLDAATDGASDGVKLALNVGGMLIAFLALVALIDLGLGLGQRAVVEMVMGQNIGDYLATHQELSLSVLAGYVFYPFALLMGIPPGAEGMGAAELLGIKTATNEFVAFIQLNELLVADPGALSERTRVILTYALCGFANFGSIGIQIGALAVMAPNKRSELARLGLPAMIAGTFACYSTACVAAIFYAGP